MMLRDNHEIATTSSMSRDDNNTNIFSFYRQFLAEREIAIPDCARYNFKSYFIESGIDKMQT